MRIAIPKETAAGEKRVALIPETVKKLAAKKIECVIEAGAGARASFTDAEYKAAGAEIAPSYEALAKNAETLIKVVRPDAGELAALVSGTTLVCLQYPLASADFVRACAEKKLTTIALDMIPRISMAQSMDVLSSQASFAGYWAVVAAAARLPKIFPMLMTAAGTVAPSRVLIMGAGVAGLQAVGTAKRLGAVVEAIDVRPETKEQVESLGGKFLEVEGAVAKAGSGGYAAEQSDEYKQKQTALIDAAVARADVVITTALIPGRPAPRLVTEAQVASMRPGSVIVDLAAEQGGNVAGSEAGKEVDRAGVIIIGGLSVPSNVAFHSSQAFSRNIEKLMLHLTKDGAWKLDPSEAIAAGCLITHNGEVVQAQVRTMLGGA